MIRCERCCKAMTMFTMSKKDNKKICYDCHKEERLLERAKVLRDHALCEEYSHFPVFTKK